MEFIPCHYENPAFAEMSQFLIRKNGWSMSLVAIGSDECHDPFDGTMTPKQRALSCPS